MILHRRSNHPLNSLPSVLSRLYGSVTGRQPIVFALLQNQHTDSRLPHEWKVANQETARVELRENR